MSSSVPPEYRMMRPSTSEPYTGIGKLLDFVNHNLRSSADTGLVLGVLGSEWRAQKALSTSKPLQNVKRLRISPKLFSDAAMTRIRAKKVAGAGCRLHTSDHSSGVQPAELGADIRGCAA